MYYIISLNIAEYQSTASVPKNQSAVDYMDIQELAEDNNDNGNCEATLTALIATSKTSPNDGMIIK